MTGRQWLATCAIVAMAVTRATTAPQRPDPQVRARIDAFVAALTSGDAQAYEAMARDNFTPEFLARRSADDRRAFIERIRGDFGRLRANRVTTEDGVRFAIGVTGTTGLEGEIRLTLEEDASRRITAVAVDVGGGGEPRQAAPPVPITPALEPTAMAAALDAYLSPLAARGEFSGAVLVARGGVPVYQRAFGQGHREKPFGNATTTRFNLGSINKIFTKTAIAQLVSAGRLALSDTIGTLLPGYPNDKATGATVRQLLTHQAGIADFFGPAFEAAPKAGFASNADYYRFVAPQPLLFDPGTRRQYCNGCYVVLGAIIERVSGTRYEDYIAEHVFKPAGMAGAGFFRSDRLPDDVAMGYTRRGPGGADALRPNAPMHGVAGSAAGGAYASAADLLAFDNALRERRLLDATMTAWMLESEPAAGGRARGDLGIAGGAPGVNASLESDGTWTVVVLANLDPPAAERLAVAIHAPLAR